MRIAKAILLSLFLTAGAHAGEQNVVLQIKGMTCPLCVAAINKSLRTTNGVISAKTSMSTEQAEVTVIEGFDIDKLLEAVKDAGFQASVIDNKGKS